MAPNLLKLHYFLLHGESTDSSPLLLSKNDNFTIEEYKLHIKQ